ncbi:MAG: pyridoxal-phosphate dependent enzyme [Saprospiraceae bacterium]|nr:pyridoxal-phosphate dependent enzyme [Saprospiraceae bacterium]
MKVYTDDIKSILNSAITKYQELSGNLLNENRNADFFGLLSEDIKEKKGIKILPDYLYKQLYIKLKSWRESEVGYSLDTLNGLCQYVFEKDYFDTFETAPEDEAIPEFPWHHPSFPATAHYKLNIENYSNIWLKDESVNFTGIHKDRLAWEVYLYYKSKIKDIIKSEKNFKIPKLSILSFGNAALSIQYLLNYFGLPALKVLYDDTTIDPIIHQALINSGCELYSHDLDSKELDSHDILSLTKNEDGIELTYGDELDKFRFYDWLSFEVLNLNPKFCFMPFGSGELFKNILEINQREIKNKKNSKRFFGNREILRNCCFVGAKAKSKNTKMKMLYAKFNKFRQEDFQYYFDQATCSKLSRVEYVDEKKGCLEKAIEVANLNHLTFEPSGIAGLAMFFQLKNELGIGNDDKVVIINTGKIKLELFNK